MTETFGVCYSLTGVKAKSMMHIMCMFRFTYMYMYIHVCVL